MKYLTLAVVLLSVTGCENYTDKTSPCVGKGKDATGHFSTYKPLSFAALQTPHNPTTTGCLYHPIGS